MQSAYFSSRIPPLPAVTRVLGAWVLGLGCLGAIHTPVEAQPEAAASAPKAAIAPAPSQAPAAGANTTSPTPRWGALTSTQQQSLLPLSGTWDTLSDGHKRKWLNIARTYPSLAPAEQEKLHSRMGQWAALKPSDRERARLNFVETKKLSPPDRASNWEAYQALSPEEREQLAKRAARKPAGAATVIKPAPQDKLTVVPVTRHTPPSVRELAISKQPIDRKTLLPLAPRPVPRASSPQD